jgi:hypothetical protein
MAAGTLRNAGYILFAIDRQSVTERVGIHEAMCAPTRRYGRMAGLRRMAGRGARWNILAVQRQHRQPRGSLFATRRW